MLVDDGLQPGTYGTSCRSPWYTMREWPLSMGHLSVPATLGMINWIMGSLKPRCPNPLLALRCLCSYSNSGRLTKPSCSSRKAQGGKITNPMTETGHPGHPGMAIPNSPFNRPKDLFRFVGATCLFDISKRKDTCSRCSCWVKFST